MATTGYALIDAATGKLLMSQQTPVVDLSTDQTVNGVKTFGSFPVGPNANPTTALQLANKQYVDSVSNISVKVACNAATTGALSGIVAGDYNNGAGTITGHAIGAFPTTDGVAAALNNVYLIKDQFPGGLSYMNGIYKLTTLGDGGTKYVLTRSLDSDTAAEITKGAFTTVLAGTANGGKQFIQVNTVTNLGVDSIQFNIFYAPAAATLDSVTTSGATTANAIQIGGVTNTGKMIDTAIKNLTSADSPYTVVAGDKYIYCDATAGNIIVNLPLATTTGRVLLVSRVDASQYGVTVTPNAGAGDKINRQTTMQLIQDDSLWIHDRATNKWSVI